MSKTAVTECHILSPTVNSRRKTDLRKDSVRVRSVFQTCGKFAAECYVTLTARGPRGHFTGCRLCYLS